MRSWQDVWSARSLPREGGVLGRLIRADGFDTAGGQMSEAAWIEYHRGLRGLARVVRGDSIFEVGCGAGAFLFPFYRGRHEVGGIDYSAPLIDIARGAMKGGSFRVCDAASLRLEGAYDILLANSVFQYFRDLEYARSVVERMIRCARKRVAIFDLPDARLESECESERRNALPEGEYEARYAGLRHIYYEKSWFEDIARDSGCEARIREQERWSCGNGRFRFNVVLEKRR